MTLLCNFVPCTFIYYLDFIINDMKYSKFSGLFWGKSVIELCVNYILESKNKVAWLHMTFKSTVIVTCDVTWLLSAVTLPPREKHILMTYRQHQFWLVMVCLRLRMRVFHWFFWHHAITLHCSLWNCYSRENRCLIIGRL